jgi:hypothetical protein
MVRKRYLGLSLSVVALVSLPALAQKPAADMSFFVTSANPGKGGDLGGLKGADAYCQSLASKVGAGSKTWHAYLSTDKENAKDRIGNGPWYNFNGVMIAKDVADLHSANNHIMAETALNEMGKAPHYLSGNPPKVETPPLQHDMMTGTKEDGTASDMTCNNWTDGSDDAKATLGHADRKGRDEGVNSWNDVHPSRGCSLEQLAPTGSAGLFYCFAVN